MIGIQVQRKEGEGEGARRYDGTDMPSLQILKEIYILMILIFLDNQLSQYFRR